MQYCIFCKVYYIYQYRYIFRMCYRCYYDGNYYYKCIKPISNLVKMIY